MPASAADALSYNLMAQQQSNTGSHPQPPLPITLPTATSYTTAAGASASASAVGLSANNSGNFFALYKTYSTLLPLQILLLPLPLLCV